MEQPPTLDTQGAFNSIILDKIHMVWQTTRISAEYLAKQMPVYLHDACCYTGETVRKVVYREIE